MTAKAMTWPPFQREIAAAAGHELDRLLRLRERVTERAAILHHDGGMTIEEARKAAMKEVRP